MEQGREFMAHNWHLWVCHYDIIRREEPFASFRIPGEGRLRPQTFFEHLCKFRLGGYLGGGLNRVFYQTPTVFLI